MLVEAKGQYLEMDRKDPASEHMHTRRHKQAMCAGLNSRKFQHDKRREILNSQRALSEKFSQQIAKLTMELFMRSQ